MHAVYVISGLVLCLGEMIATPMLESAEEPAQAAESFSMFSKKEHVELVDEGEYTINSTCEQEPGNALRKLRTTKCSIHNVSDIVVIPSGRPLCIKALVFHVAVSLELPQRAGLCPTLSVAFRPVSRCPNPLAKGSAQPPPGNREASEQLQAVLLITPPAWPLSKHRARTSPE